jgi:hypothetical protein
VQKFVKGRTNNHLTWVAVDATDFATPESALSAATKIKIYGKVRGATGVNFVSSGTGSLTNDIQHVGASALGIYTIALAKADLSDASAAWYDQYIISLSATGAAYQTLIVDGGIDDSYLSNIGSYVSNLISYLSNVASYMSNVESYLSNAVSDLQSDFQSRVPKAVATNSQLSDLHSDLRSYLVLVSDAISDMHSDLRSQIAASGGATTSAIAAKVWSDFESKIGSTTSDVFSALAAGAAGATTSAIAAKVWSDYQSKVGASPSQVYSYISNMLSNISAVLSDVRSDVSDMHSDLIVMSDILSNTYSGVTVLQSRISSTAATASDLASKIWAQKYTDASNVKASTFGSMVRLTASRVSDVQSYLAAMSGAISDIDSAVSSQYSDIASKVGAATSPSAIAARVWSDYGSKVGQTPSQVYSYTSHLLSYLSAVLSDFQSDFQSRVPKAVATNSQLSDLHSDLRSYLAGMSGAVSDIDSALTSQYSDLASKIGAVSVALSASDIADISSQIIAGLGTVDANVVEVTGIPVTGTGTTSDPWGP